MRVIKIYQKVSGEVRNPERTKDGSNKMRDMFKGPNYNVEVILNLTRSADFLDIGQ